MNQDKNNHYNSPVRAIFTGVKDLFKKPSNTVQLLDSDRLEGKKILVTGASSGLGFATAVELARRGAHVIMACRSGIPLKGEEAKRQSGSDRVDMIGIDLSDLGSLKSLAREIRKKFGKIDIVVCNAAMVAKKARKTPYGLDEMFTVNYFAKFLMINHLLNEGCINFEGAGLPRIIFVSSESHRNPKQFDWDGFGKYDDYSIGRSVEMYGYYKLLLVTLVNELSRQLNNDGRVKCAVFSLCPGPVNSNIAREAPAFFQPLLKLVFSLFFTSPPKACLPVAYLAASDEVANTPIDYLFLMQRKEMDDKATDPRNGKKLWELSMRLAEDHGLL